jgi:hypothetical protein
MRLTSSPATSPKTAHGPTRHWETKAPGASGPSSSQLPPPPPPSHVYHEREREREQQHRRGSRERPSSMAPMYERDIRDREREREYDGGRRNSDERERDRERDRDRRMYAASPEGMRGPGGPPSRSNTGDERIQMGPGVMPGPGMSPPMSMPVQALTPLPFRSPPAPPPGECRTLSSI